MTFSLGTQTWRKNHCAYPFLVYMGELIQVMHIIRKVALIGFLSFVPGMGLAHADISGFNSLGGWSYNAADSGSPAAPVNSDLIHFTTGPNNRRSLWYEVPQAIARFQASFTYRASSISASALRQGATFTIQNSPAGLVAVGTEFGYSGIPQSLAVTIETDTGSGLTYLGVYMNGVVGGGSQVVTPVNAFSFEDIEVSIDYSGSILSISMTQGANVFPRSFVVGSLESIVGAPNAYVGFTASTFNTLGSGGGSNQFLGSVLFTSVIGENYCVASPNSTGAAAFLQATGSLQVADQDVTLVVEGVVPGVPGLFLFGPNQLQSPFGDGFRCVGGATTRVRPYVQSSPAGLINHPLNFGAPYAASFTPGADLNFQLWYRDPMAGMTGFNLSNGLNLVFQ